MISRRARFAIHGLGYLAYAQRDEPIRLSEVLDYLKAYSSRLSLSAGYISKIFQDLSRAGLVQAIPGRNGGYLLARDPSSISMAEVVSVLDGPPMDRCCLSVGPCDNRQFCGVFDILEEAQRHFYDFLRTETAASVAEKMFSQRPPAKASQRRPKKAASKRR